MTIESIIVIVVMAIGFACATVFIAKNGGWKGESCQGHCATCTHHCSDPEKRKGEQANPTTDESKQA